MYIDIKKNYNSKPLCILAHCSYRWSFAITLFTVRTVNKKYLKKIILEWTKRSYSKGEMVTRMIYYWRLFCQFLPYCMYLQNNYCGSPKCFFHISKTSSRWVTPSGETDLLQAITSLTVHLVGINSNTKWMEGG